MTRVCTSPWAVGCWLILFLTLMPAVHARTWTSHNGYKTEAEFVRFDKDDPYTVLLRKHESGKVIRIDLQDLSEPDRNFLKEKWAETHNGQSWFAAVEERTGAAPTDGAGDDKDGGWGDDDDDDNADDGGTGVGDDDGGWGGSTDAAGDDGDADELMPEEQAQKELEEFQKQMEQGGGGVPGGLAGGIAGPLLGFVLGAVILGFFLWISTRMVHLDGGFVKAMMAAGIDAGFSLVCNLVGMGLLALMGAGIDPSQINPRNPGSILAGLGVLLIVLGLGYLIVRILLGGLAVKLAFGADYLPSVLAYILAFVLLIVTCCGLACGLAGCMGALGGGGGG